MPKDATKDNASTPDAINFPEYPSNLLDWTCENVDRDKDMDWLRGVGALAGCCPLKAIQNYKLLKARTTGAYYRFVRRGVSDAIEGIEGEM